MKILVRSAAAVLAAGALVSLPVTVATAAPVPHAATVARAATLDSTYTCRSTQSPKESGSSAVHLVSTLPGRVRAGTAVPARAVSATITVPPKLLNALRTYHVKSVSGRASGARLRLGVHHAIGLTALHIPRTPVPKKGPMRLTGSGSTEEFTAPDAGSYAVRIPVSFKATVTLGGYGLTQSLSCDLAPGAPSRIGTLHVG